MEIAMGIIVTYFTKHKAKLYLPTPFSILLEVQILKNYIQINSENSNF